MQQKDRTADLVIDVDSEDELQDGDAIVDAETDDTPPEGGYGPMYEGSWIHSGPGGTVGGDGEGFVYFNDGETSYCSG